MRTPLKLGLGAGAVALAATFAVVGPERLGIAADHLDPPQRTDPSMDSTPDRPADIADIYAWHTDTSLNLALTFAGPQPTNRPATYDRDVLYKINISNSSPRTNTDIPIRIRFGQDPAMANQNGVQVLGIPGTGADGVFGPVETNLNQDGVTVRAGLFDDPFFFDLQGFRQTRDTGELSFDSTRDFFAGQNLTAVVIQIPRDRIAAAGETVDVWTETLRFGGQL